MIQDNKNLEPVKILWTGGWDSTFQFLSLLLYHQVPVQPYYLIDEGRPSTGRELLTMRGIRSRVREFNPSASELLLPTKYFSVSEIPDSPDITSSYQVVKSSRFIGSQYEWLARFCKDQGISKLQLCIHEDDKAAVVVTPIVVETSTGLFRIDEKFAESEEYRLFKYFEFPILRLTKTEMANIADERGWGHIMESTWFCHNPIAGKPCGRCNPCIYTIEEGLGRRIPLYRRIDGKLRRRALRPAKRFIKRMLPSLR